MQGLVNQSVVPSCRGLRTSVYPQSILPGIYARCALEVSREVGLVKIAESLGEPRKTDVSLRFETQRSIFVDANGLPIGLALTPGEAHNSQFAGKLLSRLKSGTMLLADRAYDADWIREHAIEKGAWANIPPKSNRNSPICFSPYLYRARNLIERSFNRIKPCRRVATRYDKLAANYLTFVQLASIRLWLAAC
jgi:transposase